MNGGPTQSILRFGVFEADLHAGELKKNGVKVKLSDQAFRLLAVLLANPDQVVTREELHHQLWPEGTFVDFDHGVNLAVAKIRAALGDDADNPRFVATIPRRGYKFLAPVSVIPRTRALGEPALTSKSLQTDVPVLEAHGYPIPVSKLRRRALLVAMTAFSVSAALVWIFYTHNKRIPEPFQNFRIKQLTHSGTRPLTAIAPEGRYILSVVLENGQQSLWLHNLPSDSATQVAPPAPVYYQSLAFSPDGNYIYFRRAERYLGMLFSLYRQAVLGSKPELVSFDVDSDIAFSPDGQHIAFIRANDPEMGKYRIIICSTSGKNERVVRASPIIAFYPQSLAWSPDGKRLAYSVLQPEGALSEITLVDLPGGQTRTLARFADKKFAELRWLPNGAGLLALYHARGPYFANGQIGFVSYPNGIFRPVTRDTNNYQSLTLSVDGLTLATVQAKTKTSISFIDDAGKTVANFETGYATWFDFTPNGDLLISNLDTLVRTVPGGGSSRTIVADSGALIDTPANCGERYVVFTWKFHHANNNTNIWRINYDGSDPVQLSTGNSDANPVCSPDGKWVYYREADTHEILRVSVNGGNAERIPRGVEDPVIVGPLTISPDGSTIGYAALLGDPSHNIIEQRVILIDSRPGTHRTPILLAPDARIAGPVSFMPDGKSVVYPIRLDGVDNVWLKPLNGSPGRQLTEFSTGQITAVRPLHDGEVGVLRYSIEADVVLIQHSNQQN